MKNTNVEKGVIFHDEDSLVEELRGMDLQFIDKRRKGGCLWVVGGAELDSVMNKFAGRGIRFIFKPNGGRATKKKPGWFTKWRE
ncbi:hypothetical protein ACJA3J_12340 [Halobacillus sp. SY10]|uniref:hypothetical protein n=1 Tax=Halobacillus sp. SY10 TaxID=3381356 RepID=UPI003879A358